VTVWSPEDAQAIAEAAASSGDPAAHGRLRAHFAERPGRIYTAACADVDRLRTREVVDIRGGTLERVADLGPQ
jgi:hypothetical protein